MSRLISKTSKLESENMDLSSKLRSLEKQNKLLQDELERLRLSQSGRVEGDPSNLKVIEEIKNRLINEN
jgi:predicted RNase H-like nuclease (RuvC/YqgF family)